ncbi:MAG: extracellular solute-binding protein [Anaerolineae bacterium]|nr:extracellular solute-binding protein [Anaerolineae bacterium]
MAPEKKISRRSFVRLAALAGASSVLAACATPTPQIIKETVIVEKPVEKVVKETVIVKEPGEKAPVVVTVLISGEALTEADSAAEGQFWTVYLMEYNLKKNNTVVKYDAWVTGEDYDSKLRLLTNSGELQDVVVWSAWECPPVLKVKDKLLMPLDPLMDAAGVKLSEWVPGIGKLMKFNSQTNKFGEGPVWNLPGMGNPGLNFLYFNVDALKAAGLPSPTEKTTWAEVEDAAKKIGKPDQGIYALQYKHFGHGLSGDYAMMAPFGATILDADGKKCLMNSPESVKAWKFFYDTLHTWRISPLPADLEAMGGYKSGSAAGKLLMYRSGPWGGRWFLLRAENKNPEMGFSLVPSTYDASTKGKHGNDISFDGYGISANAKHPAECFDVLYHMTKKEAGIFSVEAGNPLPWPRLDVLSDAVMDKFPLAKVAGQGIAAGNPPILAANGRDSEIDKFLAQRLDPVDKEKVMPDKAFLDSLTAEIQKILDMPPI